MQKSSRTLFHTQKSVFGRLKPSAADEPLGVCKEVRPNTGSENTFVYEEKVKINVLVCFGMKIKNAKNVVAFFSHNNNNNNNNSDANTRTFGLAGFCRQLNS